ncbi:MAG: hypothetical protein QXU92_04020 [Candidatus Diapherotrites archaeon]
MFFGSKRKGQAFDVFKLLIAAVVAGSILLILLQVLGGIDFLNEKDPNKEASNLVKNGVNYIASPQFAKDIRFKENMSMSAKTIASKSEGLSESQICVLVSDKVPNKTNFTINDAQKGKIVQYTGRMTQKTKLLGICDRGSELEKTISEDLGFDDKYEFDLSDCAGDFESGSSMACVIVVIPDS